MCLKSCQICSEDAKSDKGPKNVFVHALLRQGVQCGEDQSTHSYCNKCNIHSNPLTPRFAFISHSSAWFINSYCSSWPLTFLQVSLQLHFSVTFSRSTDYLYYWCNISLCVSVCVCVLCVILMWIRSRQKRRRLLFTASVLRFLLPICQTHHLWQKIHCLVSLHLAVTLATAAEVNCQLG